MTRSRWLLVAVAAGVAIFVLSFVNAWIVHDRELRGEGYRFVQYYLSAWRGVGMPVLTVGVVAALAAGAWAVVLLRRANASALPLLVLGVAAAGLVASAAWPVAQDGHASSVDLSAGPLWPVGLVLALAIVAAGVAVTRPSPAWLAIGAVGLVAIAATGSAARWSGLQLSEGTGRHWTEGAYTRPATGNEPTETLTIGSGTFTVADRWAGTWEWSGWTVIVDNDPACPESRGTYHAHGEEGEGLRFVKVVDTCADGARARDLETGIWRRDS